MRAIIGKRGSGKTEELIRISSEGGGMMVVRDKERASEVFALAREGGKEIPFPITAEEFLRREYYGRGIKSFLVDDLEVLMGLISPRVPVMVVSMTEEEGGV